MGGNVLAVSHVFRVVFRIAGVLLALREVELHLWFFFSVLGTGEAVLTCGIVLRKVLVNGLEEEIEGCERGWG